MTKTLKLTRKIKGSPEEVYRAITNPFTIQLWTDEPAVMEEKEGTEFSILGGAISGKNISFIPGKQVKQLWFFGEDHPGSEVTINLEAEKNHTQMFVEQKDIPEDSFENIRQGWLDTYIKGLREFFEA